MNKDLFRDIAKYLPAKVAPAIAGILFLPIVTRLFDPADYGNYILVKATIWILITFSSWIGISVVRFHPVYENDGKVPEFTFMTLKLALISILLIAVTFSSFLLFAHPYMHLDLFYLMITGIAVFILTALFRFLLDFLRIKRKVNSYSFFSVWKSIGTLVFALLVVILFQTNVEGLLWGTALSLVLALPFLWKSVVENIPIDDKIDTLRFAIDMAKYSIPLVMVNMAGWILSLSDRYMLNFFRNASEVGVYSICYQISDEALTMFTSLFSLAFGPLCIIIFEKEGHERSQEFLTLGTRYFMLFCIPAVVGISVLRHPIVRILSTPNYYEGATIIPFVALGVFFLGLNERFGAGLNLYKKTHYLLYSFCIAGLSNIILNLLFIPKYGYMAAAITTTISYSLLLFVNIIISRHFYTWTFPYTSLINAVVAASIMGFVLNLLLSAFSGHAVMDLFLGPPIGFLIYLIILFILKEFHIKEKAAIREILARFLQKI